MTETTTVTSTTVLADATTTTTTVIAQPTYIFNGLNYFRYDQTSITYNEEPPTDGMDPYNFENNGYTIEGVIQDLDSIQTYDYPSSSTTCDLPGHPAQDCSYTAIVANGFFYASEDGDYTFTAPETEDNELYGFSGSLAYGAQQWTRNNADFHALRAGNGPYIGDSHTVTLSAGDLLPMAFLWGNGAGPGSLFLYITTPDDAAAGTQHYDTNGFFLPPCPGSNLFTPYPT